MSNTMIKRLLDTRLYRLKRINPYEVFAPVDGTDDYYVSSYGRLVKLEDGKVTLIEPTEDQAHELHVTVNQQDRLLAQLVADVFVAPAMGDNLYTWYADGNRHNCAARNLIRVDSNDAAKVLQDPKYIRMLKRRQRLNSWSNFTPYRLNQMWEQMMTRCNPRYQDKYYPAYKGAYVCDEWASNRYAFYAWVCDNFYDFPALLQLDKDLLGEDDKIYSPQTCCFLPLALNTQCKHIETDRWCHPVRLSDGTVKYDVSVSSAKPKMVKRCDTLDEARKLYLYNKSCMIGKYMTGTDWYLAMPERIRREIGRYTDGVINGEHVKLSEGVR